MNETAVQTAHMRTSSGKRGDELGHGDDAQTPLMLSIRQIAREDTLCLRDLCQGSVYS